MGDCDGSYDFSNLDLFIDKIKNDYDLVVGNNAKLKSLGWQQKYTLEEGLKQTINFWKGELNV